MPSHTTSAQDKAYHEASDNVARLIDAIDSLDSQVSRLSDELDKKEEEISNLKSKIEEMESNQ